MIVRLATEADIEALIRMRWDFTFEDYPQVKANYIEFHEECKAFLQQAIDGKRWLVWVAEIDQTVVSHIYIQLIDKVPRPGRITYPFGYMTNVYTVPEYRAKGIGSKIMQAIQEWAANNRLEFVIVWPSDKGRVFYERNGYLPCTEPMEFQIES